MQQLVCIPLHRSEWLAGCSSPAPDAGSRGSLPADDREVSGSAVRWCVVGVFRSCRGCQFKLDLCFLWLMQGSMAAGFAPACSKQQTKHPWSLLPGPGYG